MKSAGAGVYDNRLRYALLRVVGVLSGCIFIAAGLIALFDSRGSWVTVAFFVFFGVVLTAIPLLFRSGKVPPDTRIIDGTYGTFLPVRTTSAARLFVFIALALLFYALALGGLVRAFSGSVRSNFWLALLVSLGLGTLFALAARGTLNARKRENVGIFLTATHVFLLDRLVPVELTWQEISAIYPHWTKSGRILQPVKNWLTFERVTPTGPSSGEDSYRDLFALSSGTLEPSTKLDLLSIDPHRVVTAINHYLNNPEARKELGTERALAAFI